MENKYDVTEMTREGKKHAEPARIEAKKQLMRKKLNESVKKSDMVNIPVPVTTLKKIMAGVLVATIVYLSAKGLIQAGKENQKAEELVNLFANNYNYTIEYNGEYQFFTTKPLEHVETQPGYYRDVTNEELAENIYYMDGLSDEDKELLVKESGVSREYKDLIENKKGMSK